jgi:hypothetical protein
MDTFNSTVVEVRIAELRQQADLERLARVARGTSATQATSIVRRFRLPWVGRHAGSPA